MESQAEFDSWLAGMDEALAGFLAGKPAELRLDGSPASLARLERWLLDHYPSIEAIKADPAVLDGATRYLGEAFRRALGGRWRIRFHNPKYAYHGMPELSFLEQKDTPMAPGNVVTAALHRRTGEFFALCFKGCKDVTERNRPR
jgi:hypothetical protein